MIALHRNWNSFLTFRFSISRKKKRKRKKSKKNYRKLSRLRKVVREKFRLEKIKEFLRGSKDIKKEIAVGVTYQSTTRYLFDD